MRTNLIRSSILLLLGFLTIPLLEILPVEGGGASLIIVITIPFIILIAIITTIIFNYSFKTKSDLIRRKAFVIMVLILVFLNLILFPHK
ncbi:MAG: hypothetical protein HRU50_13235 [Winogradskyella sp.]|uniref:hypothetical protein n=1 Tax=Winogradskyella sp. TaxID=1883156 RepID=UPI0025F18C45|nr:hypothetical protein [Winogradskyella sp.]NRB60888.1 hypothetical protein [Winogradskyella sp.]